MNDTGRPPTFGFPRSVTAEESDPVVRPTPLPKRPKGRWFLGVLLAGACGYGGYQVWDAFFRYRAYGIVTGRTLQVSPPWDGVLQYVHIREGDAVRQGQVLLTLDSSELRQRLAQVAGEFQIAQAALEAETARLKWQAAFHVDESQHAVALYYEASAQLYQQEARLEKLKSDKRRTDYLFSRRAISAQEAEQLNIDVEGQLRNLQELRQALDERRKRAELAGTLLAKQGDLAQGLSADGLEQLKPAHAKLEALKDEQARLYQRLAEGQLRAPCDGVVLKIARFPGEYCRTGEPLLAMLEEGSLEVVLYVPQQASGSFAARDAVDVVLDPYPQALTCSVATVANQYEAPPEQIKRHYAAGQAQLPVHLQPMPESARWMALRLGSVVKVR